MQSFTSANSILSVQKFFKAIIAENFVVIESLKNSGLSMAARAPAGGKEALHVACEADVNAESVNKLIALGANVNAMTDRGFTPLHVASQQGRGELMIALIKAGANIEAISDDGLGTTPLQEAAVAGQLPALKILVAAGADTNYRERKHHLTALDLAKIKARSITVSINEISAAIYGAEKTFINQASAKISEWQRDHGSKNQDEDAYVARLTAIPFAELKGDEYFLRLQSAIQEGYEPIKKNLAPLRIAIIKLMKQYNEAKSAERTLKAIFSDLTVTPIGRSIFSAISSSSDLPANVNEKQVMTIPGSSTSTS